MFAAEKPEKDTIERISPAPYVNDRSFVTNSHLSTHFKVFRIFRFLYFDKYSPHYVANLWLNFQLYRFQDVVDPHLLMLKLNLDNKLEMTDELLASMQLISQ